MPGRRCSAWPPHRGPSPPSSSCSPGPTRGRPWRCAWPGTPARRSWSRRHLMQAGVRALQAARCGSGAGWRCGSCASGGGGHGVPQGLTWGPRAAGQTNLLRPCVTSCVGGGRTPMMLHTATHVTHPHPHSTQLQFIATRAAPSPFTLAARRPRVCSPIQLQHRGPPPPPRLPHARHHETREPPWAHGHAPCTAACGTAICTKVPSV